MKDFNLKEVLEKLKRCAKEIEDSSKNIEEIAKKQSTLSQTILEEKEFE